jgi:hypothetical protein
MYTLDITAICLSVIGMASGWVGWFLDRRKHHQEVKNLEAEAMQKYMALAKSYVEEYHKNIVEPLQRDVLYLRTRLNRFEDAFNQIEFCPLRSDCPVRKRLHNESQSDHKDADLRTDD